jgi:hypothetical protein
MSNLLGRTALAAHRINGRDGRMFPKFGKPGALFEASNARAQ